MISSLALDEQEMVGMSDGKAILIRNMEYLQDRTWGRSQWAAESNAKVLAADGHLIELSKP